MLGFGALILAAVRKSSDDSEGEGPDHVVRVRVQIRFSFSGMIKARVKVRVRGRRASALMTKGSSSAHGSVVWVRVSVL